jgi:hypothetical protein
MEGKCGVLAFYFAALRCLEEEVGYPPLSAYDPLKHLVAVATGII